MGDVAGRIDHHEVTVGDFDRGSILADDNIHAVAVFPEVAYANHLQVTRSAHNLEYVPANGTFALLAIRFTLDRVLFNLFFRRHGLYFQMVTGKMQRRRLRTVEMQGCLLVEARSKLT